MADRKLTKGTYYSCSHQKLSNSKCNTCETEQQTEKTKEQQLE
jgi:hypothetical protein